MTTITVAAPGARLHVTVDGAEPDPAILLLHAGIADSRAWDALVPHLVAAGYRAVRYDARGFGGTDADDVEFSNRADAIAVLDAIGVGRAVLVGNSRGGQIAFDTAIEFPDRVVAVVGIAAGVGGVEGDVTANEEAAFERMETLEERLEAAGRNDHAAIAAELVDLDLRFWVDGPEQPEDRVPAAIRDAIRMMDMEHVAYGRIEGRPVPLQPRAAERLGDLRCPVLAIAGELDATEVPSVAQHLAANAPDAQVVILPDVAHMIAMEAPERVADLIIDFLKPLPRGS